MVVAEKLDLYVKHKAEYAAPKRPAFVTVGPASYLAITGAGEPGGDEFTTAVGALYAVAFTIKMAKKFAGKDYAVCKLEALWPREILGLARNEWTWKLLIRVPPFITERDRRAALEALRERGKDTNAERVQLERIEEGRCVQVLH